MKNQKVQIPRILQKLWNFYVASVESFSLPTMFGFLVIYVIFSGSYLLYWIKIGHSFVCFDILVDLDSIAVYIHHGPTSSIIRWHGIAC